MEDFFGQIGFIKYDHKTQLPKIWIYKDKATGQPKGDATLTYEDEATALHALEWFNNTPFQGHNLEVQKADYYDWEAKKGSRGGRGGRGGGGGGRGGPY